jgi:hypothetical protein
MLDQISIRRFLVLPHRSSLPATGPKLFGPAGELIPCWGDRLDQDFSWKFLLAEVAFLILGVDFLRPTNCLLILKAMPCLTAQTGGSLSSCRRSPPTATVVVSFVQPYKPMVESSSSAHAAGAASAEQPAPEQPAPEQPAPEQQRQSSQRRTSQRRTSFYCPSAGSLGGGRRKTALRVVRCRLKCRQNSE